MPIYEYACDACGERFERWQSIQDKPVTTCPSCKKRRVRKLISATAFQLKGSGWYITDYARKGSKNDNDSKSKSEPSSGSSSKAEATG